MRLIDADALKRHYAWWKGGTREMTMDEAKGDFDTIIDLQPTIEVGPIMMCNGEHIKCPAHKDYERGFKDGQAEAQMKAKPKHGRWTEDDTCSICGQYVYYGDARNYCPNCGAKMDAQEAGSENVLKLLSLDGLPDRYIKAQEEPAP